MQTSFQKLAALDIKMLRTLTLLVETRNVSRTADLLNVQQSTVSYQLGKLRELLDDPILIRSGRGFEPTPYALQVLPELVSHLESLESLLFGSRFNPLTTTGTLRVASHRNGSRAFIQSLITVVNEKLPNVCLDISDWNDEVPDMLRDAKLDFAIGFAPENLLQLMKVPLAKVPYQAVMSASHPLAGREISEEDIFNYPHIVINTHEAIDRWLNYLADKRQKERTVCFSSSSLEFATMALKNTDRILFVADTLDDFFSHYEVSTQPAPYIPPQTVSLVYHERVMLDPLRSYLEVLIKESAKHNLT